MGQLGRTSAAENWLALWVSARPKENFRIRHRGLLIQNYQLKFSSSDRIWVD
jgi:hypothetical protein